MKYLKSIVFNHVKSLFFFFKSFFNLSVSASFTDNDQKHNNIIVRVWHSGLSNGDHYGHVSLQTPNSYISLWPSGEDRIDLEFGCIKAKARCNKTYQKDLIDEGRKEEAEYHLSLPNSVSLIDQEWTKLLQKPIIWFALGTNTSIEEISKQINNHSKLSAEINNLVNNKNVFNCASIVHHMLLIGGLDLTDGNYLDVGSIHNPILQSIMISFVSSSSSNIQKDEMLLRAFIYPDKISYAAKRAMIDQFARKAGHPLDVLSYYLSNSSYTDEIYQTIIDCNFDRTNPKVVSAIKKLKNLRDEEHPLKKCIIS